LLETRQAVILAFTVLDREQAPLAAQRVGYSFFIDEAVGVNPAPALTVFAALEMREESLRGK